MQSSGALRLLIAISLLVVGVAGAAAEEQSASAFFKSLVDRATGKGEGKPEKGGDTPVKQITKVSRFASVVLDRDCPDLVQPYEIKDNVIALGQYAAKEALKRLGDRLKPGGSKTAKDPVSSGVFKQGAKQLNWLPMVVEVEYGNRVHETLLDDLLPEDGPLGRKHYPTARGMLRDILATIEEKHEYEFKLFILKSLGRNAVARPGGFIYLDQGLIDAPTVRDKAYFAVAHEIAHVLQRHETKELQSTVVDSVSSTTELRKVISSAAKNPAAVLAHVKAEKNLFTRHHIDQELQADSCAARLLSRVFPSAQGLAQSLNAFIGDLPPSEPVKARPAPRSSTERLGDTIVDLVDNPVYRHPTSEERVRNLRAIYEEVLKDKIAGR